MRRGMETLQKQFSELRLDLACKHRWKGRRCLDEAGDMAVVGLVQKQGAEDVVEEGGVVPAGPLTVRIEVHLQDLWLHHSLPWWRSTDWWEGWEYLAPGRAGWGL
jgi:hypothetical protein